MAGPADPLATSQSGKRDPIVRAEQPYLVAMLLPELAQLDQRFRGKQPVLYASCRAWKRVWVCARGDLALANIGIPAMEQPLPPLPHGDTTMTPRVPQQRDEQYLYRLFYQPYTITSKPSFTGTGMEDPLGAVGPMGRDVKALLE